MNGIKFVGTDEGIVRLKNSSFGQVVIGIARDNDIPVQWSFELACEAIVMGYEFDSELFHETVEDLLLLRLLEISG